MQMVKAKKKWWQILLIIIGILVAAVVVFFGILTITEFKPADTEVIEINGEGSKTIARGDTLNIVTWNVGYCGLGEGADFFMDGGKGVMTADEERVHDVVAGIGINVHQKVFPEEIKRTASSLDLAAGRTILRADVVRAVLRQLEAAEDMRQAGTLMDRYRALSATLGQPVRVSGPAVEEFEGTAENVTEQGTLLIRAGDGLREVLAGDVSVRGLMGYV